MAFVYRVLHTIQISICVFLLCSTHALAQESPHVTLARFVHNVVDHIHWGNKKEVTLCVYGYDQIGGFLNKIKVKHLANIGNILIKRDATLENLRQCDALYIAANQKENLDAIISAATPLKLPTISNIQDFSNAGGMIEFQLVRQQVRVRINSDSLKNSQKKISPLLMRFVE